MNTFDSDSRKPEISILLPDLRGGGAERVSINLANEFARRGFSVDMVVMRAEGELMQCLDTRVRVEDLCALQVRNVLFPLMSYLRRTGPKGMIANMWPLTVIAPLARVLTGVRTRVISVEHTNWSASARACEKGFMRGLRLSTWMGYRLANSVVAVSSGAADAAAALAKLPRGRVTVIHNPVVGMASLVSATPASVPQRWWHGNHKRVLAVGTLKKIKDYQTLIRAFAILRRSTDARLLILGEGECRSALEGLVEQLGLAGVVDMPGFASDPKPYFGRAHLHVLSSTGEGLPTVIIEALEQGTPVVSTDCPSGPREILAEGRYGTLVPIGDPDALANAMRESLRSTHDTEALRARSQDFTIDKAADAYLDLLCPGWRSLAST